MYGRALSIGPSDAPSLWACSPESVRAYRKHWEDCLQPWARSPATQQELEEHGFSILRAAVCLQDLDAVMDELPWLLEGGAVTMEKQNKGKGGYLGAATGAIMNCFVSRHAATA